MNPQFSRYFVVSLLLASCACTHVERLSRQPNTAPTWVTQVNDHLRHRRALVMLQDGSAVDARDVIFHDEDVAWMDPNTGQAKTVNLAQVRQVSFRSHTRGALDGVLLAGAIGAPMGALIIDSFKGSGGRAGAATAGAVSIAVLTIPIGAAAGSRIVYRIEPQVIQPLSETP